MFEFGVLAECLQLDEVERNEKIDVECRRKLFALCILLTRKFLVGFSLRLQSDCNSDVMSVGGLRLCRFATINSSNFN